MKKKIIIVAINVLLIISIANAMLSGSHDLYKSGVDPQSFCSKCHSASAANVTLSEHKLINCTCHGYNPSSNVKYWGVLKKEPKIRRIVESSSDILRGMEECDK